LPGHIRRLYFPVLNICITQESELYQETGKSLLISGKWEKAFNFGKKSDNFGINIKTKLNK